MYATRYVCIVHYVQFGTQIVNVDHQFKSGYNQKKKKRRMLRKIDTNNQSTIFAVLYNIMVFNPSYIFNPYGYN